MSVSEDFGAAAAESLDVAGRQSIPMFVSPFS
jgi:hypothetical protein